MKVELNDIRLNMSGFMGGECHIGIPDKSGTKWLVKKNVHNDFIHAVIANWNGRKETIVAPDGMQYTISVEAVNTLNIIKPYK